MNWPELAKANRFWRLLRAVWRCPSGGLPGVFNALQYSRVHSQANGNKLIFLGISQGLSWNSLLIVGEYSNATRQPYRLPLALTTDLSTSENDISIIRRIPYIADHDFILIMGRSSNF